MSITILPETTIDPISLIGRRAGICWGADITDQDKNFKRGLTCINDNHGRTFEYVNIETIIDGYSARVIREWYTHIGGAPTRLQASTRYIDYTKDNGFDYIIPDKIKNNPVAFNLYKEAMLKINDMCFHLEKNCDIPREDSALLLPLGMTTKIVDKRNLRNVYDMVQKRLCTRAYHEYRKLMNDYINALHNYSEEWVYLIDEVKFFRPQCDLLGYCPESKGCGRYPREENSNGQVK